MQNKLYKKLIMKKVELIGFIWMLCFPLSFAQTVVWEMQPSDYSKICHINSDLYTVVKNGKIGLIRANGQVVAEAVNDSMSGYHDGRAILVRTEGDKMQITGCLTENGNYYPFTRKYYKASLRPGFPFFSENLLIVRNEEGHEGYIDETGAEVLGFKPHYTKLHPFSEGFAVININNKNVLIDKRGNPQTLQLPRVGAINKIFNAYHGLVYLTDDNGKLYTYDINHKGVCKKTDLSYDRISVDYLYRIRNISKAPRRAHFKAISYSGRKGISPTIRSSLYGFEQGTYTLLPAQLSEATSFTDDYAIVCLNGKNGILRYIDDDSFLLSKSITDIDFYEGESVSCPFVLKVPTVWSKKNYTITLQMSNGKTTDITLSNGAVGSFNFRPSQTGTENFILSYKSEGLLLFTEELQYNFIKRKRCDNCGKDTRYCPFQGSHPAEPQPNISKQPNNKKGQPVVKKKEQPKKKIEKEEKICPECGKKISECPRQGVH